MFRINGISISNSNSTAPNNLNDLKKKRTSQMQNQQKKNQLKSNKTILNPTLRKESIKATKVKTFKDNGKEKKKLDKVQPPATNSTQNSNNITMLKHKAKKPQSLHTLQELPPQTAGLIDDKENYKILRYFRYYPVTIIQVCGKRDEFMKSLLMSKQQEKETTVVDYKQVKCNVNSKNMKNGGNISKVYNDNNHKNMSKNKITSITTSKNGNSTHKSNTNNNGATFLSTTTDSYINRKTQKQFCTAEELQACWTKLLKTAQLKGKYKYREKFHYHYSAQLKALGWKKKVGASLKRKLSESSSASDSDQYDDKKHSRNMDTWKKSMKIDNTDKVFIIKGRYPDMREALLSRGWVQNPDKKSPFFDLKWTTKVIDIAYQSIKPNQIVNHFDNNACLTSKYGICKSLRSVMYTNQIDIDKFFPKSYDLTDLSDFQNFLQMYKWVYCQSMLKQFLVKCNSEVMAKEMKTDHQKLQENSTTKQPKTKGKLQFSEIQLNQYKLALIVVKRRLFNNVQKLIKQTTASGSHYPNIVSVRQWNLISAKQQDLTKQHFHYYNHSYEQKTSNSYHLRSPSLTQLQQQVTSTLRKLRQKFDPQFDIDGFKNIWIVKPAFLSRGRGIKCLKSLSSILDYSMGKETQFVVQKYIENPLIIKRRKSDIRLWVIVQDYCPPKIWVYREFYVRFCMQDYDQSKLGNKLAHLTNNSIQKFNKKLASAKNTSTNSNLQPPSQKESIKKDSMWSQQQFKSYIFQNYPQAQTKWKTLLQQMKQIVVTTVISTADQVSSRRQTYELIGYDFMLDQGLNPWLIEINTSPAMDYSTDTTTRLVKMVMEDTVKVMVDGRGKKKSTAGLFKCVYSGVKGEDYEYRSKHYRLKMAGQEKQYEKTVEKKQKNNQKLNKSRKLQTYTHSQLSFLNKKLNKQQEQQRQQQMEQNNTIIHDKLINNDCENDQKDQNEKMSTFYNFKKVRQNQLRQCTIKNDVIKDQHGYSQKQKAFIVQKVYKNQKNQDSDGNNDDSSDNNDQ